MTGIFPPEKFPPDGSTPVVSPLEHSPHEKYAWGHGPISAKPEITCVPFMVPVPPTVFSSATPLINNDYF